AFVYQCKNGLEMKTAAATIPCGNAFTVGTGTSLTLTSTLSGTPSTTVPISVAFLPSATSSKLVQGSASIVVRTPVAEATPTPAPTPVPSPAPTPTAKPPEPTKPASTTTPAKPAGRPADL